MKNREYRFLTEKHPFINDAKCCKCKHEVALTMDHYVSGKTYGFMQTELKNRNTTLHDE